nr:hypothetical protein [Streptomyces sp. DHE17-7]
MHPTVLVLGPAHRVRVASARRRLVVRSGKTAVTDAMSSSASGNGALPGV